VFWGRFKGFKISLINYNKITNIEILVLGFLGLLSILVGFFFRDIFVGLGSNYFNNNIFMIPSSWSFVNMEFIPYQIKLAPVITSFIALVVSVFLSFLNDHTVIIDISKTFFESCK
jgi:hypothetical protein